MGDTHTRLLILGGGFGGLYTALELEKRLARDPDVEITLVNCENCMVLVHSGPVILPELSERLGRYAQKGWRSGVSRFA